MSESTAQPSQKTLAEFASIANEVFRAVFGRDNPYTLDQLKEKFASDIQLPVAVHDDTTGELTYTAMPNAEKYITNFNICNRESADAWMLPPRPMKGIKDILARWQEINYTTTERVFNSDRVYCSDPIYESSDVYLSTNCSRSQKILYCDGSFEANCAIACQRSGNVSYCIRADDSNSCSNSYSVVCSEKISNSLFIEDASTLHECIFCSHISNHEYCIANTQFDKETYYKIKEQIIDWLLSNS